jgi:hypothetical protein
MSLGDEHARLARAFAARTQTRAPAECPDPEQLFEAASGNLARDQRSKLVEHVSRCAECTEAWRIAMELGVRPTGSASAADALGRDGMPLVRRTALAASVVLALGVGSYVALSVRDDAPRYRDAADPQTPASLVTGALPRDRFVLRWSPGPPGSSYSVRLSTADLGLLLEQPGITASELAVPTSALAQVKSGDRLLWQVEVLLPDGRRIPSETQVLTLQ